MILLLLLCSCAAQNNWQVSHLQTGSSKFDSSRIVFPTRDLVSGIDLELTRSSDQIFAHLQVHTDAITPYQEHPREALVRLTVQNQIIEGIAHRHEGGQRLLLTETLQEPLLAALQKGEDVKIELMGYRTIISHAGFATSYAALQQTPFRNPLQPPVPL
ncbi:MAG: hypothetical protein JSR58_07350 [Verrucomicrobia bacterium]|nr:hypothetical protein [Verrucomicrobiota bacterium]